MKQTNWKLGDRKGVALMKGETDGSHLGLWEREEEKKK